MSGAQYSSCDVDGDYNITDQWQTINYVQMTAPAADYGNGTSHSFCINNTSVSEDYNLRLKFTEPEIQRTNLASVILRMKTLNLGKIENFPFLDMPGNKYIKDGYRLLYELKAINENTKEIETIEIRNKPTWLPPQPFLNLGVKARLIYERLRARSEI